MMRVSLNRGALALLLCLLAGVGCRRDAHVTDRTPARQGPNVLLVVIDTLRADRVGCYGYAPAQTPVIDSLAARGLRLTNLFANASWTIPSMASMFTSVYPTEAGVGRVFGDSMEEVWATYNLTLAPQRPTLAEQFRSGGWHTGGFSANMYLGPTFSVDVSRGFDHLWVAAVKQDEPAEVVTQKALDWITATPQPFFCWLQYMDPHTPYNPPQLPPAPPNSHEYELRNLTMSAYHNRPFPSVDKKRLEELYDLEVAYADTHLGKLLAALQRAGLLDNTAIVLVSDHGEEFWEHQGIGHGQSLYDELLRVPGIVVGPGDKAHGKVCETQVTLLDVAPTSLDLAGLSPPAAWRGKSWAPLLENAGAAGDESVYAEGLRYGPEQRALRTAEFKAIVKVDRPAPAVFNLRADPAEAKALANRLPAPAQEVEKSLLEWHSRMNALAAKYRKTLKPRANRPTPEQIERLKSLGYLNR